jgi:ATP-dependent RNA helicase DOB1
MADRVELKKAEQERDLIKIEDEEGIKEYYELRQLLKEKGADFQAVITHPTYALPFLNAGRLVEIRDGDKDFGWGVVVAYNKVINPKVRTSVPSRAELIVDQGRPPVFTEKDPPQKGYIVDVLLKLASGTVVPRGTTAPTGLNPPGPGDTGEVAIIGVLLSTVQAISQIRINLPKDLRGMAEKNTVIKAVGEVMRRMPEGPTLLDPIKNLGIQDKSFRELVKVSQLSAVCGVTDVQQQIALLEDKLQSLPITSSPNLPKQYDTYHRKVQSIDNIKALKRKINSVHDVLQLEELKSRKRVLRRLGFTTSDDVVEMKGRVACEISTGDELLLTEMMFGGVFGDLLPEHLAALLSCFVFQEKVRSIAID